MPGVIEYRTLMSLWIFRFNMETDNSKMSAKRPIDLKANMVLVTYPWNATETPLKNRGIVIREMKFPILGLDRTVIGAVTRITRVKTNAIILFVI